MIVKSLFLSLLCFNVYVSSQRFWIEDHSVSVQFNFFLWKKGIRTDICWRIGEGETFTDVVEPDDDLDVGNGGKRLFENWRLSDSLLLSSGFSIDPSRKNFVRQVPNAVFSLTYPTPLRNVSLVAVSEDVLENLLELDVTDCINSKKFLDVVSGNQVLGASLTHRYGGHQFGAWAYQLGDGRAHLIGEYVNSNNERWELQLKGSGLTPYSRQGDGRSVLRSTVREFLCSEAMHFLGIPTTRAASLVVSNKTIMRDQFYDGNPKKEKAAVVLRVAPSWFRIGSLEILSGGNETSLLRHLVDFIIKNHFHSEFDPEHPDKYVYFYHVVFNRTIETVAKWMSVGFAHGVCNTDNYSLLGLTIDYGPFGFVEGYNPDFIPNTSDDQGRYSLGKQPQVANYNMDKLARALAPLLSPEQKKKVKIILDSFNATYQEAYLKEFRSKLGLFNEYEKDSLLIGALLYVMEETKSDFTMTFRQLSEWEVEQMQENKFPKAMWALRSMKKHELFKNWLEAYHKRLLKNPKEVTDEIRMEKMKSVNPRYVLKNWMAEQAINKADENDFTEVNKVLTILRNPYTIQPAAEDAGFARKRPKWAKHLKVSCSS